MYAFRDAFEARDATKRVDDRVAGERVLSRRSALARRGVDETLLKRNLVADLLSLINTIDLGSATDLSDLSYVSQSILNYGLPDLARLTSEQVEVDEIANNLRAALLQHEPRLVSESLHIEREQAFDDVNQRIRFNVSADMFCQPVDVPIEFVAEIEIASGKVVLSRLPVAP
jgi:type VI secretion system protein ImpF